ncbi:fructose-1,6-bisphosphatase [Frankineae bacterium MT45]|nr:fructose-1,6-bisphosphatase [Frankineae bacterium MT45]
MRREGVATHRKTSISDVVTAADLAAEQLVAERLRIARPQDGIVGEEGANRPGERTWFIDPVDGTYNFLWDLPSWCSALALTGSDTTTPLLGAVFDPGRDELWLGGVDAATTCNGTRLPQLRSRPLAEVSVASYLHPATLPDDGTRVPLLNAIAGAATVRMLGSGSVELAAVAAGRLGGWVQHDSLDWDWLPGAALVRAAGGRADTVEHNGHRWHIAGSDQVVEEIAARIVAT